MSRIRRWTPEDYQYLRNNYQTMTDAEMARHFHCHETSVANARHRIKLSRNRRSKPLKGKRNWTAEEEGYLQENWGRVSVSGMAKALDRTESAVQVRARKLGLGAYLDSGDYVTLNQLLFALGYCGGGDYKLKSWIENRGFPVHRKKNLAASWRVVYLEEFWEWAKQNRSFIDFSKMEPLALGAEPEWVPEQRRKDFEACALQRKDPWTPAEESRLKMLLSQQRYTWPEICEMMHRSHGAISRRCRDLGIKDRPVGAYTGGKRGTWSEADFQALAAGIRSGDSYAVIGQAVGRSEKCVRSKVYNIYLTEDVDKVRRMMGRGAFGDGAPELDVRHGFYISRTRQQVRRDLSILDALLRHRMNELGYDPYWQRHMCQHWHEVKGCTAGGTNCDECADFLRIQPQYCARCGGTFYEREENRFCKSCRSIRKKNAQRHWCRENQRRVDAGTD